MGGSVTATLPTQARLLAALALLVGLLLAAAATLQEANAQLPSDVALELSLLEDSDNIVRAGSTVSVRAAITNSGFPRDLNVRQASLRLLGGLLEWEASGRGALAISDQQTSSGAFAQVGLADGSGFGRGVMDKRTLAISGASIVNIGGIGQGFTAGNALRVYNSKTGALIGAISPPTAAEINANKEASAPNATEAAASAAFAYSNSLAVWEDAANDEAWLFVGSMEDTVDGITRSGRLYIYKVTLDTETITLEKSLEPTKALLDNDIDTETARGDLEPMPEHVKALYGSTVRVSGDGQTLAVAAYNMNEIGRVWIYEKPAGGWADLTWAAGLSITAIPVPTWRGGSGNTYFTWQNGKRVATTSCFPWITDANHPGWGPPCTTATQRKDWAYIHSYFGKNSITLSHDGSALIVVAAQKGRADDWTDWNAYKEWHPEAYIFERGGANWAAMTAPTAILNADTYADTPDSGEIFTAAALSRDGNTLAIGVPGVYQRPHTIGRVMLWTKPATGWASKVGPDATLTNPDGRPGDGFGRWVSFNGYGSGTTTALLVRDPTYQDADLPSGASTNTAANYYGQAWIFTAGASGWSSATTRTATRLVSPNPRPGGFFEADYVVGWDDAASSTIDLIRAGHREFHPSYPTVPSSGSGRLWLLDPSDNQPLTFARFGGECEVETIDRESNSSCDLYIADSRLVLPAGLTDGSTLTISGSIMLGDGAQERTLTDILTLTVGDVDEVDRGEFTLSRRTDGSSFPATIVAGQSTQATLKVLNANGLPSPRGSISSVLFHTTVGTLSAEIGDADTTSDCATSATQVCEIESASTSLTSANTDKIRLTITHPGRGKSGVARVRATVISASGETLLLDPLRIVFAGEAASISISEPTAAILNVDTPDPGASGSDPVNNQDVLTLTVSGSDVGGNQAGVPSSRYRATIKDPDGRTVPTGSGARVRVDWPLRRDGLDAGTDVSADDPLDLKDGSPQVRIHVDAPASNTLKTGEYTLELTAGTLTATRKFNVVGGPAAITLSLTPGLQIEVAQSLTVTASVTDEAGTPVPDGTEVTFSEESVGTGAVLILRSPSRQTTTDGVASATLFAVAAGSGYVSAATDGIRELKVITAVNPGQAAVSPETLLTSTQPNDYTVWTGDYTTRASDLLPHLSRITAIYSWTGQKWVSFAVVDGLLLPGSIDFKVPPGAVLYLANGGA